MESQHIGWLETPALFNAAAADCAGWLGTSYDLLDTATAEIVVSWFAGSDATLAS